MNDYTLYQVGEWNDADGMITPLKVPLKISSGFDIKEEAAGISWKNQEEK